MSDPIADHFARQRAADITEGKVPMEDMTSAELQAAMKAIPDDEARDIMGRSWSTGNDGSAVEDITEAQLQEALDRQTTRIANRQAQAVLAPFEDAERTDIANYGEGNPAVMSVRDRVINAIANGQNDADKAPYKAALTYLREREKAAKAE